MSSYQMVSWSEGWPEMPRRRTRRPTPSGTSATPKSSPHWSRGSPVKMSTSRPSWVHLPSDVCQRIRRLASPRPAIFRRARTANRWPGSARVGLDQASTGHSGAWAEPVAAAPSCRFRLNAPRRTILPAEPTSQRAGRRRDRIARARRRRRSSRQQSRRCGPGCRRAGRLATGDCHAGVVQGIAGEAEGVFAAAQGLGPGLGFDAAVGSGPPAELLAIDPDVLVGHPNAVAVLVH